MKLDNSGLYLSALHALYPVFDFNLDHNPMKEVPLLFQFSEEETKS